MAVEHAMFKFEDLKMNSRDDRQTDRQNDIMTTKVLSSHPCIYMRRDQLIPSKPGVRGALQLSLNKK